MQGCCCNVPVLTEDDCNEMRAGKRIVEKRIKRMREDNKIEEELGKN